MDDATTPNLNRRHFLKGLLLGVPAFLAAPAASLAARRLNDLSLSFLTTQVSLIRRSAWAERRPNTNKLNTAGFFSRVTVHHSGALVLRQTDRRSVVQSLNSVLEAHTRIRYGDIGYHFIIDYAGRVWEGRSLSYEGAHVSSANEGNIGVMLLGNFERQKPSTAQVDTLNKVTGLIRSHFSISTRRVYGHRDIGASVCPGRYLYPYVVALKSGKSKSSLA
jgi:hypothetical protein